MATDSPAIKEFTAQMLLSAQSVTVDDAGNADVLYLRTITDKDTGEIVVKDVVRVSEDLVTVQPLIEELSKKSAAKEATDAVE